MDFIKHLQADKEFNSDRFCNSPENLLKQSNIVNIQCRDSI